MNSHSDSEPDDDTITITTKKVVMSRGCRIGGASRTKQNNKQDNNNKQPMTKAMNDNGNDKHEKSTIAMFDD